MVKFLRSDTMRHSKIGKNRRKLQKWRAPRGRHSKIRRKRFGYPRLPGIGFGTPRINSGKVEGLNPVLIHNVKELEQMPKGSIAIIARVGARKKIDILKKASELKLRILNVGGKS